MEQASNHHSFVAVRDLPVSKSTLKTSNSTQRVAVGLICCSSPLIEKRKWQPFEVTAPPPSLPTASRMTVDTHWAVVILGEWQLGALMRADDADASDTSANHSTSDTTEVRVMLKRKGGPGYAANIMGIYTNVAATECPNFMAAWPMLPSNFSFHEWEKLVYTPKDASVAGFLIFGFPAKYKGPVPTPATSNHQSALSHICDMVAYITTKVRQHTILGPFDEPPFTQWCQVIVFLTRPKKNSELRWVIKELSCLNFTCLKLASMAASARIHTWAFPARCTSPPSKTSLSSLDKMEGTASSTDVTYCELISSYSFITGTGHSCASKHRDTTIWT